MSTAMGRRPFPFHSLGKASLMSNSSPRSSSARSGLKGNAPGGSTEGKEAMPSFIGGDLEIRGRLVARGDIYVSGKVTGSVDCANLHVIGGGDVTGEVVSTSVHLASGGGLSGKVTAGKVGVRGDARFDAEIHCAGDGVRPHTVAPRPALPAAAAAATSEPRDAPSAQKGSSDQAAAERKTLASPFPQAVPAE